MWVRRTPAELKEDARRWRFCPTYWLIWSSCLGGAVLLAFMSPRVPGGLGFKNPTALSRAWPAALGVFAFFFIVGYGSQVLAGGKPRCDLVICTKCLSVQGKSIQVCPCGGAVEPLTRWRWVDDENSEQA